MKRHYLSVIAAGFLLSGQTMAAEPLLLNHERFGHAAVRCGDSLYVLGGNANDKVVGEIERINSERTSVDVIGVMPHPRYWLNAVSDGASIYLVGGSTLGDLNPEPSAVVEKWDPVADVWTTLAPLPEARSHVGLVWHEGRIYAIGGNTLATGRTGRVDVYDPTTDAWTSGAPMPTSRECDVFLHNGLIHAVGGYDGKNSTVVHEVYDPASDTWTHRPDLPFVLSAHHVAVLDDTLYAFGHYSDPERVVTHDLETGMWSLLTLDYIPSRHNEVVVDGEDVWVIGGSTPESPPYLKAIQRFTAQQLREAPRREPGEAEKSEMEKAKPFVLTPETEVALKAWGEALARINTLTLEREQTYRSSDSDSSPSFPSSLSFDRKNRQLIYRAPAMDTLMDGTNITVLNVRQKRYYQTNQPAHFNDSESISLPMLLVGVPDAQAFVMDDPYSVLVKRAGERRWELQAVTNDHGPAVWTFIGRIEAGSGRPPGSERLTVDATTGLVIQQDIEMTHEHRVSDRLETNTVVVRLETVLTKINEPIPAETFTTAVDETWTRVDSRESLYVQSDDGRFALSGKPAPDFELTLLDGSVFRLSDNTGRVVVLDFWATWCGPCVKAMPKIQTFYESAKTQDVVVVGVSTDDMDALDEVREMIREKGITYKVGVDTNNTGDAYFVQGIPCVVLIDRNGIVQGRKVGFSPELDEVLRQKVDVLLAGGSLPSAVPLKEGEVVTEAREVVPQATRMSTRYFETIWETSVDAKPEQNSFGMMNTVSVLTEPRWLLGQFDRRVIAYNVVNGEKLHEATLPEEEAPPSGTDYRDSLILLNRADEAPLFIRHRIVLAITDKGNNRRSSRVTGGSLTAFATDGSVVWSTEEVGSNYNRMSVVPYGKDRELLIMHGYMGFAMIDETGRMLVRQSLNFQDRVHVFDSDGDGIPEFYLIGARTGAYRLKLE